jgi:hydrogenase maturation protein HypF
MHGEAFEDDFLADETRFAIIVRGTVQGVGFRPFVYRAARDESLVGWVLNDSDAVRIEVQGERRAIARFLERLRNAAPPPVRIAGIETREIRRVIEASGTAEFTIRTSHAAAAPAPTIPADLATCEACRAEIDDPGQRRYRYPFTNCTNCGPRWSIIERLPYDRPRTSMRTFEMCDDCRREYEDPADRRFHAQPIACPECGPRLKLLTAAGEVMATGDGALREAVAELQAGRILAVKGLGGFQLLADATRADAVARLRERKRRPEKPLAVMMPDLDCVREYCEVSDQEAAALMSPAAPILLLRRHVDPPGNSSLSAGVAPDNPYLGIMLPYTPLHHLIAIGLRRPVVCTSGNVSDEPMAISTDEAVKRLGKIADCILTHDRPIVRPVDDSVARVSDEGLRVLRRARGYAPLPIRLHQAYPTVLAVGGHLKNTVAMNLGAEVVFSPHIGDLDNLLSVEVHRQAIEDLTAFFAVTPERVACDFHPDYASTRLAEQLAARWDVPLIRVQHHHAHVAACMAEHHLQGPVLGLSWDGTGYGTDGTVWGGEILLCSGPAFERLGHLRAFPLPGGDAAAREPRRAALGVLYELWGDDAQRIAERWFTRAELRTLLAALRRPGLFPRTSSLGRLFDAVAALCGLLDRVSFEAQAAMALEFAVDETVQEAYPLPLQTAPGSGARTPENSPAMEADETRTGSGAWTPGRSPAFVGGSAFVGDWEPLVCGVLSDRLHGVPIGVIAAKFHNALAAWAVAVAQRVGCPQIVLSGGCFQNAVLETRVRQRLSSAGFRVYTHHSVPPGDGGIALGQILIAAQHNKDR